MSEPLLTVEHERHPEQQYALIARAIAEHRAPHVHVGSLVATMLRLERSMANETARQLIAAANRDGFIVTVPGSTSAPAPQWNARGPLTSKELPDVTAVALAPRTSAIESNG